VSPGRISMEHIIQVEISNTHMSNRHGVMQRRKTMDDNGKTYKVYI